MKQKSFVRRILLVVFITIVVMSFFQVGLFYFSGKSLGREILFKSFSDKIGSDLFSFEVYTKCNIGEIRLSDGTLVNDKNYDLYGNSELIDNISKKLGVLATIFVKDNDDFRRVATSIKDVSGNRAVGTFLGKNSVAYGTVISGKRYIGEAKILGNPYITGYDPIFNDKGEVIGLFFVGNEQEEVNRLVKKSMIKSSTSFMLLTFLIGILVSSIVYVSVKKNVASLSRTNKILYDISEGSGDLTQKLIVATNDEIGQLALYFNKFLGTLDDMMFGIKQISLSMKGTGEDLSASTVETSSAITQITANIENVKDLINKQHISIGDISSNIGKMLEQITVLNRRIDDQASSVAESSSAIEEMVANIKSVSANLENNSNEMRNLLVISEAGKDKISNVNELIKIIASESQGLLEANIAINNISSQTNLLAMNAAIEAAHAGEYGKGFAVVSDEIRKLSESAAGESESISVLLNNIKVSIDSVTNFSDEFEATFNEILKTTRLVSDQEFEISNAMKEQSHGGTQLLEAIVMINDITVDVKNGSDELFNDSKIIANAVKDVNDISSEIALSMEEMSSGAKEINSAAVQVADISVKNASNIQLLSHEISKFKTRDR